MALMTRVLMTTSRDMINQFRETGEMGSSDYPYIRAFPTTLGSAKGMPTVSRIRILGSTLFITTVTLYDAEGRVVQVQTHNAEDQITDIASNQYGFAG